MRKRKSAAVKESVWDFLPRVKTKNDKRPVGSMRRASMELQHQPGENTLIGPIAFECVIRYGVMRVHRCYDVIGDYSVAEH